MRGRPSWKKWGILKVPGPWHSEKTNGCQIRVWRTVLGAWDEWVRPREMQKYIHRFQNESSNGAS